MVGDIIKTLRENKGISQKELSTLIKVASSTVGMYESNKRVPSSDMLDVIASYFNVSVDYLLGRTNVSEAPTKQNWTPTISNKDKLDIIKESEQMIVNIDKAETVEFCGTPADDEDKEFLRMAYEKFLTDVRIYNKQKYTPKKYKK
ncbi:helix-turn-helix domain-containing protein [Clostridium gasigenes]|uniref:Helix-turn-helix transcriptional regulator n=1 Tax=Clostridium gasigenes TaxID=94869 RepID=A0A7X0VS88_9CLOT|nr:helix-turn-helix transcriptional regulator [Clostridium gasigenes]MBB6716219.1 helix-turn-helix transcriptional regulator [Clostridium gasigenes]